MMRDQNIISARPRLTINGDARPDLDTALLQLSIQLPLAGQSSAEINLQNWGPADSGNSPPDFRFADIGFGNDIEIKMSEAGEDVVFSGQITGIEERYGDGAPHLVLLAEDGLHRLARQRHSRSFEDTGLSDLVQEIAGEADLDTDINIGANISGQWLQLNESNMALLQRLLPPIGIWPRLENGALRAKPEEPTEPVVVSAQDGALQVRIVADLNHQPTEVQVQGYDLAADETVHATNSEPGGSPSGTTAADVLQQLSWEGESPYPQPFAFSQEYADRLASGRFQYNAWRFLHGEVLCRGIPALRSGRYLQLQDVSPRLTGDYRIIHCSHRFDGQNGYQTRMKVNRADMESA